MHGEGETFGRGDHKRRETAEKPQPGRPARVPRSKFVAENGDKVPEADKTELAARPTPSRRRSIRTPTRRLQAAHNRS
jgi:hypothetical protein